MHSEIEQLISDARKAKIVGLISKCREIFTPNSSESNQPKIG